MSRKCRYCAKPLPEEAAFCPYCARSQLETLEAPEPLRTKRKPPLLPISLFVAAALLVCGGWWLWHSAQAEEGPVETTISPTDARQVQGSRIPCLQNGPNGYLEYREETPEGQVLYHLVLPETGKDAEVSVFSESGRRVDHYYTSDVKGTLAARGIDLDTLSTEGQKDDKVTQ